MKRPTKAEVDLIKEDLIVALAHLRAEVTDDYTRPISTRAEHAMAHVESFCAIALRVFAQTNSSKIREAARLEEISAHIQGRGVIHG